MSPVPTGPGLPPSRMAAHLEAAKAALAPVTDPYPVATPEDETPVDKAREPLYLELDITRAAGSETHYGDGTAGTSQWRLRARAVADARANANYLLDRASEAFEGAVLTIGDSETTPLRFDTHAEVDTDAGRFSGLMAWTYFFD